MLRPCTSTELGILHVPMLVAMLFENGDDRWSARSASGPLPVACACACAGGGVSDPIETLQPAQTLPPPAGCRNVHMQSKRARRPPVEHSLAGRMALCVQGAVGEEAAQTCRVKPAKATMASLQERGTEK